MISYPKPQEIRVMGKRISAEDVSTYHRDGVLFPIPVLDRAEVAQFRAALEEMERYFGRRPAPAEVGQSHLHFAWAARLATHPRILDAVEDLIGPDIIVHASTIFHKYPFEGAYVSWHQDSYFLQLDRADFVSAWVALSDSNQENGCLRVVRGSHRSGRLHHTDSAASENNMLVSGLNIAVAVQEEEATDVVLRAGEMSLHHLHIVHGSNANHSPHGRIGFAIRYVAPHVSQATPHHAVMLARGSDRYGHFQIHQGAPKEDFERAIAAQREFSAKLREQRQAQGRRA